MSGYAPCTFCDHGRLGTCKSTLGPRLLLMALPQDAYLIFYNLVLICFQKWSRDSSWKGIFKGEMFVIQQKCKVLYQNVDTRESCRSALCSFMLSLDDRIDSEVLVLAAQDRESPRGKGRQGQMSPVAPLGDWHGQLGWGRYFVCREDPVSVISYIKVFSF